MSLDNVQLWFARDKDNKIVTINEVYKENKEKYYCPLCNSEIIPRQGKINSWCFAHIDKSKCSSESMYHFWIKNKLLQKGDRFKIQTDIKREYICNEILVEESYKVGNKEYRPDLTVKTIDGAIIYFEMNYSNEKKLEDYLDMWIELGNIVVEVDVKTLINSESSKLPIFKAKYYNGKCFNVKRKNNSYYNIIGKYKERLIEKGEYDNHKKNLERLDWLWKDVVKYKQKEVDIEYMTNLIDSVENEYKKGLLKEVLNKPRCNGLYYDYLKNKSLKIIKWLKSEIRNLETDKYKIVLGYIHRDYDKNLNINIEFYNLRENTVGFYSIFEYSKDEILKIINGNINSILIEEQHDKDLKYAINNNFIKNVIKRIDEEIKLIDNKYNFHDKFGYDLYVSLHYDCNYKLDICIKNNKKIIYSNNKQELYDFFNKHVKQYLKSITPFKNVNHITELINNLDLFYNKINFKQYKIEKQKMGRHRYRNITVINNYRYGVKYRSIAENCIRVEIYKQNIKIKHL